MLHKIANIEVYYFPSDNEQIDDEGREGMTIKESKKLKSGGGNGNDCISTEEDNIYMFLIEEHAELNS